MAAYNTTTRRKRVVITDTTMTVTAVSLIYLFIISSSANNQCSAFVTPQHNSGCVGKHRPLITQDTHNNKFIAQPNNNYSLEQNNRQQPSTSLQMGIRSFIKKKILRRSGGGDDESSDSENEEDSDTNTDDSSSDDVNLHSLLQSPESAGLMEGGTKRSEDNLPTSSSSSGYSQEDIQQRIRRVKGGGMTEEEKMNFLNTALTRTNERKKSRGPPIRQKIPGMDNDNDDTSGSSSKSSSSTAALAGSDPNKNLWDAITKKGSGGKGSSKDGTGEDSKEEFSVASLLTDGKLKNEQAKRLYIESITNPDRFSSFSAMKSASTISAADASLQEKSEVDDDVADQEEGSEEGSEEDEGKDSPSVEDSSSEDMEEQKQDDNAETDFTRMKRQIADDREFLNPKKNDDDKSEAKKAVESILAMIGQNDKKREGKDKNATKADNALASRLEQAAEEQEKRDAETRLAAEKRREEERMAREEAQRQREEEFHKKEEARIEAARQKAEDIRRQEEEKIAAEKAEIMARQKAQDDYWAKKLEKERKKQDAGMTTDQMRVKEVAIRDKEEKMERDVASNVETERTREEERSREDPHEGEILKEAAGARQRDRERVRDIEIVTAAKISRTVPKPSNEDVSASSFIAEQRRKKEEIDRLRKFDADQLKAMNSPLPSPGKMKRQPAVTPKMVGQVSPTMYRAPPIASATTATPKSPAPSPAPGLDLASLTMAKNKSQSNDVQPPPPPSPPPRLDLASLTMAKTSNQANVATPPPTPSAPVDLSLASLTMAKNKKDSASSPPSRKAPAVKKPAKRVVRQQVPIKSYDDGDEEDDDDLMRSGAPGMSIADALKQQRKSGNGGDTGKASGGGKNLSADAKAKQWGIDMSKFS